MEGSFVNVISTRREDSHRCTPRMRKKSARVGTQRTISRSSEETRSPSAVTYYAVRMGQPSAKTSDNAFLRELDETNRVHLARISEKASVPSPNDEELDVKKLLVLALKNELEATECAAAWIATTKEVRAKLSFARQAGDEAKHYRLIEDRLVELGFDARAHDPTSSPRSPLLSYLLSLETTVERVAAGQFTREALAVVRNDAFMRFCESRHDRATYAIYRDVIQPDEAHHHELGRRLLAELAIDEASQDLARKAAARTLELAEELQEIARLRFGIAHPPGC